MKLKKLPINRRLIFEFISITFAVFLGLFFSGIKEDIEHNNLVEKSEKNIIKELESNLKLVKKIYTKHKKQFDQTDSLIKIDYPEKEVRMTITLRFFKDAAWKTCKLSKAISYMNIDKVTAITSIYALQDYYHMLGKTQMQNELLSKQIEDDKEYFKYEMTRNFNLLKLIVPTEKLLIEAYNDVIKILKDEE